MDKELRGCDWRKATRELSSSGLRLPAKAGIFVPPLRMEKVRMNRSEMCYAKENRH
jgi:hypothetical protein